MDGRQKIPIYLVTGYLGSGKTTFLKKLITEYRGKLKIAIVQNEFAPGHIDGGELRRTFSESEVLEINNGSVFCVCRLSDFITKAADFIRAHNPDLLVIEASGLSDPIAIREIMNQKPLAEVAELCKIWTVVDANIFPKLSRINQRVKHQVEVADEVILNKCDVADRASVDKIKEDVAELNSKAQLHSTSYCDIPLSLLPPSKEEAADDTFTFTGEGGRPDINVAVFKTRRHLENFDAKKFFKEVAEAERIKGYVRLTADKSLHLQGSFDLYHSEVVTNYHGDTELVSLGGNITPRLLRKAVLQAEIIS